MDLTPVTGLMDELSRETWASLVDAHDLDVDWGEVTITHTILLALNRLVRAQSLPVLVNACVRTTRRRAGRPRVVGSVGVRQRGGLQHPGEAGYLGKKKPEYQALGHKGALPRAKQYDTLLRHAAKNGTLPFHLLYNGWTLRRTDIAFPSGRDTELFGCAVVHTSKVRRIRKAHVRRGMNEVSRFAKISMPWSNLLRLPSGGPRAGRLRPLRSRRNHGLRWPRHPHRRTPLAATGHHLRRQRPTPWPQTERPTADDLTRKRHRSPDTSTVTDVLMQNRHPCPETLQSPGSTQSGIVRGRNVAEAPPRPQPGSRKPAEFRGCRAKI